MATSGHHTSHYKDRDASTATGALAQVRNTAETMLAEGRSQEAFEFLLAALDAVLNKSRTLELEVARLRRAGRSSERIDPQQLALLFEQFVHQLGTDAKAQEAVAEAREDAELDQQIDSARRARQQRRDSEPSRRNRLWQTRNVARQVHTLQVPPLERTCERCGGNKRNIGQDVSHVLEYVPGHFVEHEYHLQKWACGSCKRGVTTATAPPKVIERSAADASLLAHVVVSKYVDHMPLHRLHRVCERSGATIPVSTLADWVGQVAERVAPLVERIGERMLRDAYVVSTDATGLRVLDPRGAGHIQRGTIWAYVGDDKDVVFRYTPTGEGASGPWSFLAGRRGYVQADAASVFDRLFNGQAASATEVGCWAHARRRFVALQDTDCRAAYPLELIARLYRIERLAQLREASSQEREALRRDRSTPVLEKLQRWLVATAATEPPSSELAKATGYVLNHWRALTRFTGDGRLSLDNNLCERQLRDVALGRKNFLFAGSHGAAHRTATIYSLMRTCAQHAVPPTPYLTDVLLKLAAGWKHARLDELLPDRWQPSTAPT